MGNCGPWLRVFSIRGDEMSRMYCARVPAFPGRADPRRQTRGTWGPGSSGVCGPAPGGESGAQASAVSALPAVCSCVASAPLRPAMAAPAQRMVATRAAAAAVAQRTAEGLQVPHGGKLVNLMVDESKAAALKAGCNRTLECSDRNACDVELLVVGGFSPLDGFMSQADYESVVKNMRLSNGLLFGLPIVMDTRDDSVQARTTPSVL